MTLDILAIGEPLMEFAEQPDGRYLPGFGGDTSNCAIAAARLGARSGYLSAVGDDAFGQRFLDLWDREGVNRSHVLVRPGVPTGLYFISYGPQGHQFSYRRAGSAASRMAPGEVPADAIASARILHASGISQAISDSACDSVFHAIATARGCGVTVAYDTNLRLSLWPLDRARAIIHAATARADIVLPGVDDARQLLGKDLSADAICDFYLGQGAKIVALTLGADGALVATPERRQPIAARRVASLDATGAGDTFDGAFLTEWLRTGDPFRSGVYANAAAALSTLGQGAVAPMPKREAVEAFLAG
ncbi:MAG: sugar kinase [Geminicoccaceae bacterium]